jgi:phenylacetate-CoA ligase
MTCFLKTTLGSKEIAEKISEKAKKIPAYQKFLAQHGYQEGTPFEQLPQSDKQSYALVYPLEELLANEKDDLFYIARSSGSSGQSFYWPQLKSSYRSSVGSLRGFLESNFAIDKKQTMAIVALNLGGWIGGDSFSWILKNIAMETPYPFLVFSPGSDCNEILEVISKMTPIVDQIILFIVPSAIAHLHLNANQRNQPLPLEKLKYMILAEPFPESQRISLQKKAGIDETEPFMFSLYGSADTGSLCVESLASIAVRQLLHENTNLAISLGIEFPTPHFFHFLAYDSFLETIDGHLCVTRWQGIPLVRYLLYDRVAFYSWKDLKEAIITSNQLTTANQKLLKIIESSSNELPDVIAVTGRADKCLIIGGINLTEYMLDAVIKCEDLHDILTGLYQAKIVYQNEIQHLHFTLEVREGILLDEDNYKNVYNYLIANLCQRAPSFLMAWNNFYKYGENNQNQRILQLNFVPWPTLSKATETSIKQRGIIM